MFWVWQLDSKEMGGWRYYNAQAKAFKTGSCVFWPSFIEVSLTEILMDFKSPSKFGYLQLNFTKIYVSQLKF